MTLSNNPGGVKRHPQDHSLWIGPDGIPTVWKQAYPAFPWADLSPGMLHFMCDPEIRKARGHTFYVTSLARMLYLWGITAERAKDFATYWRGLPGDPDTRIEVDRVYELHRHNTLKVAERKKLLPPRKKLAPRQQEIYDKIFNAYGKDFKWFQVTNAQLLDLVKVPERTLQHTLKRLQELGFIERKVGGAKGCTVSEYRFRNLLEYTMWLNSGGAR